MAKQYYVFFYLADGGDGIQRPFLPNTNVYNAAELKKYVANNGLPVGWQIASCQAVNFNVTKKTISVEIDDIAIGGITADGT